MLTYFTTCETVTQIDHEALNQAKPESAEQGIAGALARALANRAKKIAPGMNFIIAFRSIYTWQI